MDEYRDANRRNWDERADVHPDTDYYDVAGFLDGKSSLHSLERDELGEEISEDTDLLHLQCHFGLDTLSWAREGASVVGVDFSEEAIELARELAEETNLDQRAEFVEADVLALDLDRQFDVVFTTYGVLYWLPDIDSWAETVGSHLRPGGTFYIAEIHPFGGVFEDISGESATLSHPYFGDDEPLKFEVGGSYAAEDAEFENDVTYEWSHGLGEIVSALADAGLRIDFLHEHPWADFRMYENMTEDEEGRWWPPEDAPFDLPLTFSIRATAPEQ